MSVTVPPRLPRDSYRILTQRELVAVWWAELDQIEEQGQGAEVQRLGAPAYLANHTGEWEYTLAERWGVTSRTASTWTCPQCSEKHDAPANGRPVRLRPCRCIFAAGQAVRSAYRDTYRHELAAELWRLVDVPDRYRRLTLDDFQPRKGTSKALRACRAWLDREESRDGLVLIGGVGAGKTHLAVATARASVEDNPHTVEFVSAAELVERHRASGFSADALAVYTSTDLLILDDLGQCRATDYVRDTIYSVLDARYSRTLPVIITSNLTDAELSNLYGAPLVSRLYECATWTQVTASDYRAERARGAA